MHRQNHDIPSASAWEDNMRAPVSVLTLSNPSWPSATNRKKSCQSAGVGIRNSGSPSAEPDKRCFGGNTKPSPMALPSMSSLVPGFWCSVSSSSFERGQRFVEVTNLPMIRRRRQEGDDGDPRAPIDGTLRNLDVSCCKGQILRAPSARKVEPLRPGTEYKIDKLGLRGGKVLVTSIPPSTRKFEGTLDSTR